MNRRHLTPKQRDFLDFVSSYIQEHSEWPTYRELVEKFDFRSPNSVTQNIQALLKKGFVRRDEEGYHLVDKVKKFAGGFGIPIRGMITAGGLQEAVDSDLGTISMETLFPKLDQMYALKVSGRSMIGEGIQDGDYVLLIDDDIPDGGIGAVLYNGETSLKRVYTTTEGLRLEPANDEYPDIVVEPSVFEEVSVLGRYVGHMNSTGIYKKAV